jgi:hypothetical protein
LLVVKSDGGCSIVGIHSPFCCRPKLRLFAFNAFNSGVMACPYVPDLDFVLSLARLHCHLIESLHYYLHMSNGELIVADGVGVKMPTIPATMKTVRIPVNSLFIFRVEIQPMKGTW